MGTTLFGRSTRRRRGYWSQPRGTPRDRAWWRYNWTAFVGFVAFLAQKYPAGYYSAHRSAHWPDAWTITPKPRGRAVVSFATAHRPGVWVVSGRMARRHGISEAFLSALADATERGEPASMPRYLHTFPLTTCKHGHDLTDPANVYTMTRKRGMVEHVERRCRACNRARVAQHRQRRR